LIRNDKLQQWQFERIEIEVKITTVNYRGIQYFLVIITLTKSYYPSSSGDFKQMWFVDAHMLASWSVVHGILFIGNMKIGTRNDLFELLKSLKKPIDLHSLANGIATFPGWQVNNCPSHQDIRQVPQQLVSIEPFIYPGR